MTKKNILGTGNVERITENVEHPISNLSALTSIKLNTSTP